MPVWILNTLYHPKRLFFKEHANGLCSLSAGHLGTLEKMSKGQVPWKGSSSTARQRQTGCWHILFSLLGPDLCSFLLTFRPWQGFVLSDPLCLTL